MGTDNLEQDRTCSEGVSYRDSALRLVPEMHLKLQGVRLL